jgi:hypothetical protein
VALPVLQQLHSTARYVMLASICFCIFWIFPIFFLHYHLASRAFAADLIIAIVLTYDHNAKNKQFLFFSMRIIIILYIYMCGLGLGLGYHNIMYMCVCVLYMFVHVSIHMDYAEEYPWLLPVVASWAAFPFMLSATVLSYTAGMVLPSRCEGTLRLHALLFPFWRAMEKTIISATRTQSGRGVEARHS